MHREAPAEEVMYSLVADEKNISMIRPHERTTLYLHDTIRVLFARQVRKGRGLD